MVIFILDHWRAGVEILILWVGLYQVYRAFRKTRGARILVGLVLLLMVLFHAEFVIKKIIIYGFF